MSYPNVKLIRDAQRRLALKNNIVFWDSYEFMGGDNSMVKWVNAKPALAREDYTHFTIAGTKAYANGFVKALTEEYNKYKSEQN